MSLLIKLSFKDKININGSGSCSDRIYVSGFEYIFLTEKEYKALSKIKNPKYPAGSSDGEDEFYVDVKIEIMNEYFTKKYKEFNESINTNGIYRYICKNVDYGWLNDVLNNNFDICPIIKNIEPFEDDLKHLAENTKNPHKEEINVIFSYISSINTKKEREYAKDIADIFNSRDTNIPHSIIVDIIKKYPEYIKPYMLFLFDNYLDQLDDWLKYKDNIKRLDEIDDFSENRNLLWYIVTNTDFDMLNQQQKIYYIKKLVKLGSDVNIKFNGNTLLHEISIDGGYIGRNIEIAGLLLDLGGKVVENNDKKLPDIIKYIN